MDMPQELVNLTDDEKDKSVGDESDSDIENDDGEDTDEDSGEDEEEIAHILSTSDIPHVLNASTLNIEVDDEIDSPNMDHEIDVEESYQKIDKSSVDDLIKNHYPELILHNFEEISAMSKVLRNKFGDIIDDLHHTLPYITRFEKAKILGVRSRQINTDPSVALVEFDSSIIDGYKIALEEYKQQKIPFIIKRPLPDGTCEYWKFSDLEQL
jgi:DNA-directed RNA polymerases I, II, and III subunit RPABC2